MNMQLNSFNHFRGVAIFSIVANHSITLSGWQIDTLTEKLIVNLVIGGSTLFVFISGFLFHHVYYEKYNYLSFLKKKIKNIFVPYLVLSIPPIIYFVFFKDWAPHQELFFGDRSDNYYCYIRPIILYLATGSIIAAFWYIPFIMTIFAISPLIVAFAKLRPAVSVAIILMLFSGTLFVQCPIDNLSVPQWVIYHLPTFLLGVQVSIYRETFYRLLSGKEVYLLLLVVFFAFLQAYYYPGYGSLHKPFFEAALPDVQMLQKICLSLFFMVFMHRYEESTFSILDQLANTSFAIYFLHSYVLYAVERFLRLELFPWQFIQGPILWIFVTISVTTICVFIAHISRYFFKSYSRLLIGY